MTCRRWRVRAHRPASRTPRRSLPPPGGRSPGEWGRGGSGAQAHNSQRTTRASLSTHRAQRARGPGALETRRLAPLGERRSSYVTPPSVATAGVNARLPPPVLARKVPREATGESKLLGSGPRDRRGRTPQERRASREFTLERKSRRGPSGARQHAAGRSVCRSPRGRSECAPGRSAPGRTAKAGCRAAPR